tara:strand:- start:2226 stop:2552 length:327 start_codon:yes stop_codon:yes gene_type:complete
MARSPNPAVHQRWSRLIERYEQSDLTIAGFCDQNGISTASFYQWRRRIRNQAESRGEFLAVEVTDRSAARDVKVRFPCGTQIELNAGDTESLRLVVDRLAPRDAEANP